MHSLLRPAPALTAHLCPHIWHSPSWTTLHGECQLQWQMTQINFLPMEGGPLGSPSKRWLYYKEKFSPPFLCYLMAPNWASQVAPVVKNPPANVGDAKKLGSVPGWGRSPGEGNGNPLQYSCLENPMDGGAWRATVHGSHRVRHDWARISCYILVCVCTLSHVWLFATPWTVIHQAPLSMGILQARILYCHALLQGDLPNPGIKPRSPSLQEDSLPSEPPGKPIIEKEIKHTLWDCSFYIPYVVILERSVELCCLDSILTSSCYLNPQKRIQINEINFLLKVSGKRWMENELFRTTLPVKEHNLITSVQFFDLLL